VIYVKWFCLEVKWSDGEVLRDKSTIIFGRTYIEGV
jgi:hypothetical protein